RVGNRRCGGNENVPPAGDKVIAAPDHHHASRPHRRVATSRGRSPYGRCRRPCVRGRIVPSAGVEGAGGAAVATPDHHYASRPDRRVGTTRGRSPTLEVPGQVSVGGPYLPPGARSTAPQSST